MNTPIYSTKQNSQSEAKEHIYLGNLKKVFHHGKDRLVGNVLLDPFLNIPETLTSTSAKTGKKVIRIYIDENKYGTDMYGFTHSIRVDTFKEENESNENAESPKAKTGIINHRLNISESDIVGQNDYEILKAWSTALDKSITEIGVKIKYELSKNNKFPYTDFFKKMDKERSVCGILSNQIKTKCGLIKRERHETHEKRFSAVAKEILSPELFMQIVEKLNTTP